MIKNILTLIRERIQLHWSLIRNINQTAIGIVIIESIVLSGWTTPKSGNLVLVYKVYGDKEKMIGKGIVAGSDTVIVREKGRSLISTSIMVRNLLTKQVCVYDLGFDEETQTIIKARIVPLPLT